MVRSPCATADRADVLSSRPAARALGQVRLEVFADRGSYSNGYVSASGSRKKSNGLRTAMSATRSTSTKKCVTFSGNTTRARKLPCGSCCQFKKWPFGLDPQRVAQARRDCAARGAAGRLRTELHAAIVLVTSLVIQGDMQGHSVASSGKRGGFEYIESAPGDSELRCPDA